MILIILILTSITFADDLRPDWVRDHPLGYKHRFIVGSDYAGDYGTARLNAYQNAVQHLLEESGIHVDPVVTTIDQLDNMVKVQSSLTYRTNAMSIDSLRVMAEYQNAEIVIDKNGKAHTIYECHMLIRCLRKENKSKPWPVTLALGNVILPGSSHLRIGVNTRGRWILWRASAILLGAVGSWMMADELKDKKGELGDQFRKAAIIFTLGYGLFGVGSAFDVVNSRYLIEYD